MTRLNHLAITCVTIATLVASATAAGGATRAGADTGAAAAAVKASPDLTGELAKQLGSSPEQAAGAAGALFGVAKSSLKGDEFAQVAKAVPGMAALLKAAPASGGASGKSNPLAQVSGAIGGIGGLAAAASAFSKLGLSPDLVSKAIPVLTSFVSKSGGADVGKLLAGALK